MQLIDSRIVWSASDLTAATSCEYALVRRLDVLLHGATATDVKPDPLLEHIARLGDVHEAQVMAAYESSDRKVDQMPRAQRGKEPEAAAETLTRLRASEPNVVGQACLFDGDFLGYADFLEPSENGWVVCDAKLARQARPRALLQLAAYADQLQCLGLPVAPEAVLILGTGDRETFPLHEIMPVFAERRARLREIIRDHRAGGFCVAWGDERYVACGKCPDCEAAVEDTQDVLLAAGLRADQRKKLRDVHIRTVADLANATKCPETMGKETFENLRAQARMQLRQLESGEVCFELRERAEMTLGVLPAPSKGDLFFDFEGDPLYQEHGARRWGLEYLWGILEAPDGEALGDFRPLWAHKWRQERAALVEFMDYVAQRRAAYPDMHIYHYAPYEVTALKRLVREYETHEQELDDLLRSGVFVDLYATVRGAIRISQPSYSIKKLEPLYMPAREGDVQSGDVSIAEYREYTAMVEEGDDAGAGERLRALAEYNKDDCVSTLLLRDWLLARASDAGVEPEAVSIKQEGDVAEEHEVLHSALVSHVGDATDVERTAEQQAFAMLANALGYFRREELPWWWGHFYRLTTGLDIWCHERDVFQIELEGSAVVSSWATTGRQRKPRRTVRLVGDWSPGSTLKDRATVVYPLPGPPGAEMPEQAVNCARGRDVEFTIDEVDPRVVFLTEDSAPEEVYDDLPIALVPAVPPHTKPIRDAIIEVARSAENGVLPECPATDILLRRPPRLTGGRALPVSGDAIADVVEALTGMADSYVAIQGPPGTGKSWTGARVIKSLVEVHGWRIGVVAQSHAVVENLLDCVVEAGLDPTRIAKAKAKTETPAWVAKDKMPQVAAYVAGLDGGCVVGGTAWDFTGAHIERASLDLLVIDEAGQFALAPTIGVSVAAQRLLLLGDPQQLPQVSQGTHAEPVNESALGWLMEGHDTLPPDFGYFLEASYRMHPDLCAVVSRLSYEGRLHSAPQASERALVGVAPGLQVVGLDHEHDRTESVAEAEEVLRQVRSLIGTDWREAEKEPWRKLTPKDLLVVAPYNAQVNLIRETLSNHGQADVRVGTVDKFQGQQAPVVIVSMTASSHGDVPRGMGFLLNRNRVNVAISRAQWLAVLVRSKALTSYMPTTTGGLLELGAFAGLSRCAIRSATEGAGPP